ncbi:unnamed protein product, partial [Symbiodinium pilosum]
MPASTRPCSLPPQRHRPSPPEAERALPARQRSPVGGQAWPMAIGAPPTRRRQPATPAPALKCDAYEAPVLGDLPHELQGSGVSYYPRPRRARSRSKSRRRAQVGDEAK